MMISEVKENLRFVTLVVGVAFVVLLICGVLMKSRLITT